MPENESMAVFDLSQLKNDETKNVSDVVVPPGIPMPEESEESSHASETSDIMNGFLTEEKELDLTKCPVKAAADYYKENPGKTSKISLKGISTLLMLDIMAFIIYIYETYATVRNLSLDYVHLLLTCKVKYLVRFASGKQLNSLYQIYTQYSWKNPTNMNCLCFAVKTYLVDRGLYPKCSYDDNIWILEDMYKIADDRRSATERMTSIRFDRIKNHDSIEPIKAYTNYLIVGTTLSVEGNIIRRVRNVTEFANLIKVPVEKATHDDIVTYISKINEAENTPNKISQVRDFYDFLVFNGRLSANPVKVSDLKKQNPIKHNCRTIPDTVILQIFDCLPSMSEWAMMVFLCIFTTGMRIGEALSLKRDTCLKKSVVIDSETGAEKSEWSLCWYVTKTKTYPVHPIPEELGLLMEKYLDKTSDSKSEYLFPSTYQITKPVGEEKFRKTVNQFIIDNNIRMPNGALYHFRAHDLRHTFASKLNEYGLTIYYIAKALNHKNTEMTILYVDNSRDTSSKKMKDFFDKDGVLAPLKSVPNISDESSIKEWMEKHGNARLVQDGFCDRSKRLGKCSRTDGEPCITCEWYRTSVANLDAHKSRVELLVAVREAAESNGNECLSL